MCVCFVSLIITPFESINFIAHVQEITLLWTNKKAACHSGSLAETRPNPSVVEAACLLRLADMLVVEFLAVYVSERSVN